MSKDCIKRSKLKLQPHQIKLVNFLKNNRGVIAAFNVGTGKTLIAVTASQCYLDEHPDHQVIVVTPKSLVDNFKKEIKKYGAKANDRRYQFLTLRKFGKKYNEEKCPRNAFLIIDEAHNLRNPGNKKSLISASINAIKCAKRVDKVLLMTATPVVNSPLDMLNLAAMVKGEDELTIKEFYNMLPKEMCGYFKNTIMFFENPKTKDYPTVK